MALRESSEAAHLARPSRALREIRAAFRMPRGTKMHLSSTRWNPGSLILAAESLIRRGAEAEFI